MNTRPLALTFIAIIAATTMTGCSGGAGPSQPNMPAPQPPAGAATEGAAPTNQDWRNKTMNPQEEYDNSAETPFKDVSTSPLSTFSSDVDTASYSNMRRQISMGQAPQGVRIEELVNYFDYNYPAPPKGAEDPFSVTAEVAACPWAPEHQLAMIGVQATRTVPTNAGNNIVFLIDVSGSMSAENKLPLLAQSFSLLVDKLTKKDVVSIVTYAGSNRIAADSVPGSNHTLLHSVLDDLTAGGSTGGAAGLQTAYDLARKNFIAEGNNRIILATDGDFNVGQSTVEQLTNLIETERASGVYISVLGFGMGNLKDNMMESIADHGNGNYAYIDTLNEARKVLVNQFDSTMFVVAQDLKLQVEFNGATVQQYRLIGYDNRRLENEDFSNDAKDAGDVGAGHSVTAFYELVPASGTPAVDKSKYRTTTTGTSSDYFTVSVRYKTPGENTSKLVETPVTKDAWTATPSADFRFGSAVTEFGLILIDSQYKQHASLADVLRIGAGAQGEDPFELRHEFLTLVDAYSQLG